MAGVTTRARWRERLRSTDGLVSIEMVVLLPAALLLLFLVIQGAVYYQGRTVALSSAQEGARRAASHEATNADGEDQARGFAARVSSEGVLDDPDVEVTRDEAAGTVTVTVTGTTMSLVPGWDPEVSQSATRPIEEFTKPENYQGIAVNRYQDEPRYQSRPLGGGPVWPDGGQP